MDHRIYHRLNRSDFGVYGTRRYPKGSNAPGAPETSPFDPNANPVTVSRQYSAASIAPHANTVRWTYTVPPMRRARLESARAFVRRVSAGAPGLNAQSVIFVTRAGTTTGIVLIATGISDNTVSTQQNQTHMGPLELFEGDKIEGTTQDDSVGGTIDVGNQVLMIEYDAIHKAIGADLASTQETFSGGGGGLPFSPLSGGSGGGTPLWQRSESPLNPLEWTDLGGGYYAHKWRTV